MVRQHIQFNPPSDFIDQEKLARYLQRFASRSVIKQKTKAPSQPYGTLDNFVSSSSSSSDDMDKFIETERQR